MKLLHRSLNLLLWNFNFMNILPFERKKILLQLHTAIVKLNFEKLIEKSLQFLFSFICFRRMNDEI